MSIEKTSKHDEMLPLEIWIELRSNISYEVWLYAFTQSWKINFDNTRAQICQQLRKSYLEASNR